MPKLYRQKLYILISVCFAIILIINSCSYSDDSISKNNGKSDDKVEKVTIKNKRETNLANKEGKVLPDKNINIGLLQYIEHQALDSVKSGIIDAIKKADLKDNYNIRIDYQNAHGEQQKCQLIVDQFVKDGVDLIVAIATPAAEAASKQKEVPVVFAAVTEPQTAGLVESWEKPNTNVTGVSDLTPVEALLDMAIAAMPNAENIGVIYNDAEINSVVQIELSYEISKELGINIIEKQVTGPSEVESMAETLANKVDIVWVPTDNTVLAAIKPLINTMNKYNIPVIGASTEFARGGAMYATGYDYYLLGLQSGDMAIEVLKGANIADIPVRTPSEIRIAINMKTADEIGYQIPFEMMLIADEVYFE
ncbi:ABC transporter substrate-binding protein [Natranaerofaba carboxydovora]|uniref:ABC transporter substrate-binding protein n=1 Tax=Natranaerofaba carboxydovora TaxID=2742683 RepID=UPI001F13C782|nr:ABC transporter substrate-binding protein [Natranaerofaba carboxydovora]UMZ72801.1 ABC transporter substrate binding protein [Natranaerofaba carboxydovora]